MRRQIKLAFAVIIALCITVVIVLSKPSNTPIELPTVRELKNCELFIENDTCEIGEYQVVNDATVQQMISQLCTDLDPFRPYVMEFDMILGVSNFNPCIYFLGENVRYSFAMNNAYEQMRYDFIHRDKPLLYVGKAVMDEAGQYQEEWLWLCSMDASDYAALYKIASRYSEGAITVGLQWTK